MNLNLVDKFVESVRYQDQKGPDAELAWPFETDDASDLFPVFFKGSVISVRINS